MADNGAYFGNPHLARQGASMRARSSGDELPVEALLRGLLGEAPDEYGSVLDAGHAANKGLAQGAFGVGTALQLAPLLAPAVKGVRGALSMVGAGPVGRSAQRGVIKAPGGNWDRWSVDHALSGALGYTRGGDMTDPVVAWSEKNLRNYLTRDLATERDPVRKLLLEHPEYAPQEIRNALPGDIASPALRAAREKAGFDPLGAMDVPSIDHDPLNAAAEPAHAWDLRADRAAVPQTVETYLRRKYDLLDGSDTRPIATQFQQRPVEGATPGAYLTDNGAILDPSDEWMLKADPKTPIHDLRPQDLSNLGFPHIVDELENAVDLGGTHKRMQAANAAGEYIPDLGPSEQAFINAGLHIDPDKIGRMSVADAIAHVSKIDKWRAEQEAVANAARANSRAAVPLKEYPETGMKWVELKMPEDLPEGWAEQNGRVYDADGNYKLAKSGGDPRWADLEDALKYEGEQMRHCVGGYCDPVASGSTRILSLRDPTGKPHATIELSNPQPKEMNKWNVRDALTPEEFSHYIKHADYATSIEDQLQRAGLYDAVKARLNPPPDAPPTINQIKGFANGPVKPEALPHVLDLLNGGVPGLDKGWGAVNDLGLQKIYSTSHDSELNNFMMTSAPTATRNMRQLALGRARQEGQLQPYMTREAWESALKPYIDAMPEDLHGLGGDFARGDTIPNPDMINGVRRNEPPQGEGFKSGGSVPGHDPYSFRRSLKQARRAFRPTGYAEGGSVPDPAIEALRSRLDERANEADTAPSDAQKAAGNYKHGPVYLHGMRISVENPAGSKRKGVDADGEAWEQELTHHYGYVRGTAGRDKDHIDVFLGPHAHDPATPVHVVDQYKPHTGEFDEHKVMIGFPDDQDAVDAYHSNYGAGWRGFGDVTTMDLPTFKRWAFEPGRRVKPAAEHSVTSGGAQ